MRTHLDDGRDFLSSAIFVFLLFGCGGRTGRRIFRRRFVFDRWNEWMLNFVDRWQIMKGSALLRDGRCFASFGQGTVRTRAEGGENGAVTVRRRTR